MTPICCHFMTLYSLVSILASPNSANLLPQDSQPSNPDQSNQSSRVSSSIRRCQGVIFSEGDHTITTSSVLRWQASIQMPPQSDCQPNVSVSVPALNPVDASTIRIATTHHHHEV